MTLLDRANEVLRQAMLETAKRQKWTGWEDATIDKVAHISIQDRELIAVVVTIGEALDAIADRFAYLEDK